MPARRKAILAIALALAASISQEASAMIRGGKGNEAIRDPGWPRGAAALFNHPGRVAWWEGPPFGGGQWHSECRGDAKALSALLAGFAAMDVKTKRVVVHDGPGQSFWLNLNDEPDKREAARADWALMVWQPENWERLRQMPAGLNPTDPADAATGPPAQVDVYTTDGLRWADVQVPAGVEVIDQRLEAHGFGPADGVVLEGRITDLETGRPQAGRARLQTVEPRPEGGYRHEDRAVAESDADGRWVVKNAPAGWHRVVVEADGFVPRIAGYGRFDDRPRWQPFDTGLARPATVSGRVVDDASAPLAGVDVALHDVSSTDGGRYERPDGDVSRTDADGQFRVDLPRGHVTLWVHKAGYCRPGLGLPVAAPTEDMELVMMRSAAVRVTVDFEGAERPGGYIVQIVPEGGEAVGKWSGSGQVDAEGRIAFQDIPPGTYVLTGRPNPSGEDQVSRPLALELKGGMTAEVTLPAAPGR